MKIYLICPVRNIDENYRNAIEDQVKFLESCGNYVYYPARDTNQNASEIEICEQNKKAIEDADAVFVIWDGKSHGCLFDLGIAFALGKRIVPITGYVPRTTTEKSFQNLIYQIEESFNNV